jgi:cytochrome c-type biogenesis protein CcmH
MPGQDRQQMIQRMVDGLAARLAANPADAQGWVRLLRSRMVLEQGQQAARDLTTARGALAGNAAGLAQVNQAAAQLGVPGA